MADGGPFGDARGGWPRPRSAPDAAALAVPVTLPTKRAAEALAARGVATAGDLLELVPRRYRNYAAGLATLAEVQPGAEATVRCRVESIRLRPTRRPGLVIVEARVADETGIATAVWFNQRYLLRAMPAGSLVQMRVDPRLGRSSIELAVREHELLSEDGEALHTAGVVPVYDATKALSSRVQHELIERHLHRADAIPDPLPAWLRLQRGMPLRRDAVAALHAPLDEEEEPRLARRRLAYEELVLLQLALGGRRRALDAAAPAQALGAPGRLSADYRAALPFELTAGQGAAIRAIDADLKRTRPMRRLLIGDVGSGKTAVAVHALLRAIESGGQGALMAPTETLARQHAGTVRSLVEGLGIEVDLVTADVPAAERRARAQRIRSGDARLVVGTHALLEPGVEFDRLLVAVIDEQHRFGVEQRAALADAAAAHTLHMTATPIPRSLALALYGDLDVTELRELPAGRQPIKTRVISEAKRADCYAWLRREWDEHRRQAYVVCALVDGSETVSARAAEAEAEHLARVLAPLRVGLLHGKQRSSDKAEAMRRFVARETQVLVATTVIEVGVDVANATAIVIEDADRFGLSQLHQLRGRVGRGADESHCFLFASREPTEAGVERLDALRKSNSGFELADLDLRMRGEGELAGARQAGRSDLRHASLTGDRRLAALARRDARYLLARGLVDAPLARAVEERFGSLLERIGRA